MNGTMDGVCGYLSSFLLGEGNASLARLVSYGPSKSARIIIEPSGFFNEGVYLTEKSLPQLPLPELDNVPILFGTTDVWEENGQLRIGADLIASAFFLLSRYEECVRRDVRDQHGRFIGRDSLPYQADFLNRPIVEEYGALLRGFLRRTGIEVAEPAPGFRHIWLTHDVDQIWTWDNYYRALRTTVKNFLTGQPDKLRPLRACHDYRHYDPVYTFPWLVGQDNYVRTAFGEEFCTPLYFFMGCTEKRNNDDGYMSNRARTADLIDYLQSNGCTVGYHVSYAASLDKSQVRPEIARVQEFAKRPIVLSRNHYLASREPEDFYTLLDAGITDDFTMGYADVSGFRLGTCRPVQWIDPVKREVTPLTLHPLTVMECTLDNAAYMGIRDEEDAFSVVDALLHTIHTYGGEAVLLWHSPSVFPTPGSYQRKLYERVLELLKTMA